MLLRNGVSTALALVLVFASTVCACEVSPDTASDDNPHAHHQSSDSSSPVGAPCSHEGCTDCSNFDVAVTPDRDAKLQASLKLELDDDGLALVELKANIPGQQLIAYAIPPPRGIARAIDTPVTRQDLLLE